MVLIKIPNALPAILRRKVYIRAEVNHPGAEWFLNSWDEWELRCNPPAHLSLSDFAQNQEGLYHFLLQEIARYWQAIPEPAHGG